MTARKKPQRDFGGFVEPRFRLCLHLDTYGHADIVVTPEDIPSVVAALRQAADGLEAVTASPTIKAMLS